MTATTTTARTSVQKATKLKIAGGLALLFFFMRSSKVSALGTGRFLNQADLRWGSKTVGNGNGTYAAIGCVTTCVTIVVNMLKGTTLTPDQLKPGIMLTAADYIGSAIASDQALTRLGCVVRGRVRSLNRTASSIAQMRSLIDDCLAKGGVAIVRVDYDLSTAKDNHSVVCFKKTAAGYHCADPAGGVEVILNDQLVARRTPKLLYSANGVQPVFRA